MFYTLMHKNVQVADIVIDANGIILRITDLQCPDRMPLGTFVDGRENLPNLQNWLYTRQIPNNRNGVDALEYLELTPYDICSEALGLSLSDCHWLRPQDADYSWEDVNFYNRLFDEEPGKLLFNKDVEGLRRAHKISWDVPESTTNGALSKRWEIRNGRRYLTKGSTPPHWQQPYNEAIASLLAEKLEIPHVDYHVELGEKDIPMSVCPCFASTEHEFIPADQIRTILRRDASNSLYEHYVACCRKLGVEADIILNQMIVLDYLMLNNDRHFNNFGLMRNTTTLEYYPAPIFDTGASLGCNWPTDKINWADTENCRPFRSSHEEQIQLVTDLSWIDFSKLRNLEEKIWAILATGDGAPYEISNERSNAIMQMLNTRIESLEKLADRSDRVVYRYKEDSEH